MGFKKLHFLTENGRAKIPLDFQIQTDKQL